MRSEPDKDKIVDVKVAINEMTKGRQEDKKAQTVSFTR